MNAGDSFESLADYTRLLAMTAMGIDKADVVVRGGRIVNVNTGEIENGKDIAIKSGRVVLVGCADHTIGENTEIIDATGYTVTPGFLDGHLHVESSMLTVGQFARAVLPHGTTTIFMDPHEIANVMGKTGIQLMISDGKLTPLRVFATVPSCVPAAPVFEDAGACLGAAEIAEILGWDGIVGLGEMMNYPGVIYGDDNVHAILKQAIQSGKPMTGHYASPDLNRGLNAYAAAGLMSCHESTTTQDALARMRLGMYAKMREGSAWQDVKETIRSITEGHIDSRYAVLVSDDVHPQTLSQRGHMDYIVRKAIQQGVKPVEAVQMVTINPAQCFQMDRHVGSISPGRCADLVFLEDFAEVRVARVMIAGRMAALAGQCTVVWPTFTYPAEATDSVHLNRVLTRDDFIFSDTISAPRVIIHVIGVQNAQAGTRHLQFEVAVEAGQPRYQTIPDVAKAAVIERHCGSGTRGLGYVHGLGIKSGAVASTVAHDSHNLLIIGMDEEDMAVAGNTLARVGGGMVVVKDREVQALLPLPIAGLMSGLPLEDVTAGVAHLERAWKSLGSNLTSPFMTMALLSLPVIPELRLTNRGLVDTLAFQMLTGAFE